MAVNESRITGRDVLAKTFQAKTKRGYDPVEVDAYLELVAAQVDMLHGDIARAQSGTAPAVDPELISIAEERDALAETVEDLKGRVDALRAENQQLRSQVTAVAPPPPAAEPAAPEPPAPAPAHAASSDVVDPADKASEESYELVLRMARRSAEETISEAHARAEEIVADANYTAAQISRESDRKAFEAANKVQEELASVNEQIESRHGELAELDARSSEKRQELRDIAQRILLLADDSTASPPAIDDAEVVDLRAQPADLA